MVTSISDILALQNRRRQCGVDTFEMILAHQLKRIERVVVNAPSTNACLLTIPEFVLGRPRYALNDAVQYVMDKLRACGFGTQYRFPNGLVVSWDRPAANDPLHGSPTKQSTCVVRPISDLRPSGRFVLNLTK